MTDDSVKVEIWKKIVDVQQHFNDLELRIRNFALAVAGAFLGLGGYAIKDGGTVSILSYKVAVAGIVVFAAVVPLAAFYFMDRLWYHRLLEGSVAAGIEAETELKNAGYVVDLGTHIKNASPFRLWRWTVRSKYKMDLFYILLFISISLISAVLAFGINPEPSNLKPKDVNIGMTVQVASSNPSAGSTRVITSTQQTKTVTSTQQSPSSATATAH